MAKPSMFFQYVPNDGPEFTQCEYGQIRDLPDYEVTCGEKKFTAHVIVRQMQGGLGTAFEVLYWVTEPAAPPAKGPRFNATSTWLRIKDKSSISSLSLSQAVENDYASLMMDWRP
jgi:hypothetical protein